jgi:uncharacterized protein (TIGR03437 family)
MKSLFAFVLVFPLLISGSRGSEAFGLASAEPEKDLEAAHIGAVPVPNPDSGMSPEAEEQIKNLIERLKDAVEGATSESGKPAPGVGPLTTILLHFDDLGCGGIAVLLHKTRTQLSLRKFDKETDTEADRAANTAKIDKINEILARLAEACVEHRTTPPKPPKPPEETPVTTDPKGEADYTNVMRKCDPDGKIRDDIRWNERRLDETLEKNPGRHDLIDWRRAEITRLRGQLCPCFNNMLSTAQLAGDKEFEELVKGLIASYCNTPVSRTTPPPQPPHGNGKAVDSGSETVPEVKKSSKLGEGTEFKSIQPTPGDGTAKDEGAYLPPIAGPGSTIVSSVVDPNEVSGQGVIVGTVDETGKRKFYQATTDAVGHLPVFIVPAGVTAIELFRQFDKNGNPSGAAHCDVGQVSHVTTTEPLPPGQIPAHGPAITEANSAIDRGGPNHGTITLHTRATDPSTTRVLIDGKPVETFAASDSSVLARVPSEVPLGAHQIAVSSGGVKSNTFQADVISTQADALVPMRTGTTQTVRVHVSGVPPEHKAVMHFEVTGGARLRGGAPSAEVSVKNGMATVEIQGVHAGQLVVKYQLRVAISGYWSVNAGASNSDARPGN